ncbi:putative phosphoserine phosphatase [Helianthus annuus]|uniref:Phosphoserine phosphatase n=1 Tax=Helianthus annuus TaxID=4232 RepID=A0A9K3DUJ0_HELAN|nr:putative phosphoserine phosphatase [Helianthus annuus]KAJ0438933.1 putative phosphoserine phosphatase [Helianthus annuus]KAJ0443876.1 putative phosphoserine phosphatase [Helianthus annuus]KAJ0461286.1 putative phosphoserine phosphatase [Helianthus annuus]KAJ0641719.1 putative phosphoserine phosphatase [Helianthus annuus]
MIFFNKKESLFFYLVCFLCLQRKEKKRSFTNLLFIQGGGESLNQLYKRCTNSLQAIGSKHQGERVVVVTHGGVIRALHEWASLGTGHRAGRILNSQCITLIGSRQIGHQIMGGCQSSEWSRVLRLGFWWRSNFRLGFFVHVHLLTC